MATAQAVLDVTGMHCKSCSALIDETLADMPGIVSATTDKAEDRSTIEFDPEVASVDSIVAAIAELGYSATPR